MGLGDGASFGLTRLTRPDHLHQHVNYDSLSYKAGFATGATNTTALLAVTGGPALAGAGLAGSTGIAASGGGASALLLNPGTIRFTQNSIGRAFGDGSSLRSVIDGLRSGRIDPSAFPPIRVFERGGVLYTLDNRRLFAFQQAGLQIRAVWATAEEVAREAWKFTTQTDGLSIVVRGGL